MSGEKVSHSSVFTPDGWELPLRRAQRAGGPAAGSRPVLIVPGYGMNGFIFGFHPRGTSLEWCLTEAGVEVWTVDLRGTSRARAASRSAPEASLRSFAREDLSAAARAVLQQTATGADRVDMIGGSLGGSIIYAHLALCPSHRVGSVVAIGSPLVWTQANPLFRWAMGSPRLMRRLRLKGTRRLARAALPLLVKVPGLLTPYMNAAHVDLDAAPQLTRTVEDPQPLVNRDLAHWLRAGHMKLAGVNVTDALSSVSRPLLLVLANRDGIVPDASARSALDAWGGDDAGVLAVGTDEDWYAHADLFVGHDAPSDVFDPMVTWLSARW